MEEKQSRQPLLYLFVALTASVCLAVTIAYLEIRRDSEVEKLREEVAMLIEYVEILKVKINRSETFTRKIEEMLKKEPKSVAAVPGTNYDDEYAYDDNEEYDDEYEEDDDPKSLNNSQRAKRSIDDNTARLRNILHMRRHATFQEGSDNPPVMAKIVITGTEEETSPGRHFEYHSKKEDEVRPANKNKHKNKFREDVENVNGCQQNSVLAHFGADTSAIRGQRHYEGNHRMYHPNRIFRDWTPAEWVSDFNVDSQVEFDNGYVTITDAPGIYFFYAQIFYADTHDSSGYKVLVNNHPVFQCTTTALSHHEHNARYGHSIKRNSCFTGGLLKLQSGDKINLEELEGTRYTVFEKTRSFFGLFRVATTT